MAEKNKKTPLEEMAEEIDKMGTDEFFKRLDIFEKSLGAGVFDETEHKIGIIKGKTKDEG